MTSMFATIISLTWSISACTLKSYDWDVLIIGHCKYLKTIDKNLILNSVQAHVVILSGSPAEDESEAFLLNLLISLKTKKFSNWATFLPSAMTRITWQWRGWTLCSWRRQLLSGLSAQTVLRTCPTPSLRIWTPRLDHRQSLDRKKSLNNEILVILDTCNGQGNHPVVRDIMEEEFSLSQCHLGLVVVSHLWG